MAWVCPDVVEQETLKRNKVRAGLTAMEINEEQAFKFLVESGTNYDFLPDELRDKPGLLLKAIETHPGAIQYASLELRNDQDIIRLAFEKDPSTIRFASQHIICNTAFMRGLIEVCDPKFLYTVAREVKKWQQFTDEIVSVLLSKSGHVVEDNLYDPTYNAMFSFFPDDILNKKWVAMAALQAGNQLYWRLDDVLKSDEDMIRCIIEHSINEFRAVPQECITKSLALAAVSKDGKTFMHLSVALKDDADVLLAALPTYFHAMKYASSRLLSDKETVLRCVNTDGNAIIFVSRWLQSDPEVGLTAVGQIGSAINLLYPSPNWCTYKLVQALAITSMETALECNSSTHVTTPALILLLKRYFHHKKQYLEGTRMLMLGSAVIPAELGAPDKRVKCGSAVLHKMNLHGLHFARLFKSSIASYLKPLPNRIMEEEAHLIPLFTKWGAERGIKFEDIIDRAAAKIIGFYA